MSFNGTAATVTSWSATSIMATVPSGATTGNASSGNVVITVSVWRAMDRVNSSNELTSTPTTSYSYDANGNLVSETNSTGTTSYTWDFENRLTNVTLPIQVGRLRSSTTH